MLAALLIAVKLTCFGQATMDNNTPDASHFLGFESGLDVQLEIRNDNASDINFYTGTNLTAPPRMYIRSNGFIGMGDVSLPAKLSVQVDEATDGIDSDALISVNNSVGLEGHTRAGLFKNDGFSTFNVGVAGVIETGYDALSQVAGEFAARTGGDRVIGVRSTSIISSSEPVTNSETIGVDTYVAIASQNATVEDMYGIHSYIDGGAANNNIAVYAEAPAWNGGQPPVNLAGAFVGSVYTTGTYYTSDENYKSEVESIGNADELLSALNPVTYFYEEGSRIKAGTDRQYGFISQEVDVVMPELTGVVSIPEIEDPDGNLIEEAAEVKAMRYNDIIALLVAGYQGQKEALTEKESEIETLEAKIASLEEQMSEIVASVERVASQDRSGLGDSGNMEGVRLAQNVPNLFIDQTRIDFELVYNAQVRLELSDAQGRVLDKLIDGSLNAGAHSTTIDGSSYPAGIYYYTLYANGEMVTKKMIKR